MRAFYVLVVACLVAHHVHAFPRVRRQAELQESNDLTPLNEESVEDDPNDRDKRMLEGVTQAKYGVKNAILGFVFGKINQLIDSKTRLIERLDKMNIAQNKMYGIEPPSSPTVALGNVVSSVLSPKLNLITGALGGLSGGSSGSGGSGGGGSGGGLGSLLSIFTGLSSSSAGGGGGGGSLTISDSDSSSKDDDDDDDDDDDKE